MSSLIEQFHAYVSNIIDSEGVYPAPGFALDGEGGLHIAAITDPSLAYEWFWNQISNELAAEVVFGLDRTTEAGQGTKFADVVTCVHWREGGFSDGKEPWGTAFRIGVINYQHEPRIVEPWDWKTGSGKPACLVKLSPRAPLRELCFIDLMRCRREFGLHPAA